MGINCKKLFPGSTIHCFELSRATYQTLSRNLIDVSFVLNNVGLGDQCGAINYKDYGTNSVVNTILLNADFHDKDIQPQLVQGSISTGAVYCAEKKIEHIDFLKIDVEGAEHLVLKGFSELLDRQLIV